MKTVNLDEITSKCIRMSLEAELNQKLDSLKAFIDEEILLILGNHYLLFPFRIYYFFKYKIWFTSKGIASTLRATNMPPP